MYRAISRQIKIKKTTTTTTTTTTASLPLTIITKCSILDIAAVLDPPLASVSIPTESGTFGLKLVSSGRPIGTSLLRFSRN